MRYIILGLVLLSSCSKMSNETNMKDVEVIQRYAQMVNGTMGECFSDRSWTTCKITRTNGCAEIITYGEYEQPLTVVSKTPECRRGK